MKKIYVIFSTLIFIFFASITIVFAHPGRTDASGGHYNRSTGEYHYHHGYPEHQHPNGVCPYETAATTVTSSSDDTYSAYDNYNEDEDDDDDDEDIEFYKTRVKTYETRCKNLEDKLYDANQKANEFESQTKSLTQSLSREKTLVTILMIVSAALLAIIIILDIVKDRKNDTLFAAAEQFETSLAKANRDIEEQQKKYLLECEKHTDEKKALEKRIKETETQLLKLEIKEHNFRRLDGMNIHEIISTIPYDTYFVKNGNTYLPYDYETGKYGSYTVFCRPNSSIAHSVDLCSGSFMPEINYVEAIQKGIRGCAKCFVKNQAQRELVNWYDEFVYLSELFDQSGIDIDYSAVSETEYQKYTKIDISEIMPPEFEKSTLSI